MTSSPRSRRRQARARASRRHRPRVAARRAACRRRRVCVGPIRLSERRIGTLPAPLEDPGASLAGARVVLAGGLTARDTSTAAVIVVHGASAKSSRALPAGQHDAPAAALGGSVYVFGGGDGIRQLDHILRIDSRSGRVTQAGRLPAASSDASAATVGSTAYVVGGYTGTRWLDTIVAFRAGGSARVVAHLPVGLRYAAVAPAGVDRDRGRLAGERFCFAGGLSLRPGPRESSRGSRRCRPQRHTPPRHHWAGPCS